MNDIHCFPKTNLYNRKLFVSIYSTKKYFTMFYIQSLAPYEQKQQQQNIPTWSLSFEGWLGCDKIPW